MSNWLKMAQVNTIEQLLKNGWSHRRIARELSVHRVTVARHARRLAAGSVSKATIPTAGSAPGAAGADDSKATIPTTGSAPGVEGAADSKVTIPTAGKPGRTSQCEPLRIEIEAKLSLGLCAQRVWQDLRTERNFVGGYESVKRYVRALRAATPAAFRRMETLPGEQAQVDFGQDAPTRKPGCSKLRRPHVLRVVLSCSRKSYSEVVWHQDTESFLRALENAFVAFGGVPETIIVDNLKAAVLEADWFDPTLNPKLESFARHYCTVILPTKPRMPRHKGKVERGVDYVQENGLKGRVFESLEAQNAYLREWEKNVADLRIHGTTKKQVRAMFEDEKSSLRPLPQDRFPMFEETERIVSRDGHIAVAKSFYSAPPEFLGRTVWVRYDSHLIRIFDRKMKEVRVHARVAIGKFSTHRADILDRKINAVERGAEWLLERTAQIGEKTAAYAQALLKERGIDGMRSIQGLLSLAHKHPWKDLEHACDLAHRHGQFRLKTLRNLLAHGAPLTEQLEFVDNHPIIRDLHEYGDLVRDAFLNSPVVEGAIACANP